MITITEEVQQHLQILATCRPGTKAWAKHLSLAAWITLRDNPWISTKDQLMSFPEFTGLRGCTCNCALCEVLPCRSCPLIHCTASANRAWRAPYYMWYAAESLVNRYYHKLGTVTVQDLRRFAAAIIVRRLEKWKIAD